MKGIDHLVLCGRNHETMRESFSSLGFTLTPQAQHPFGTGNSLIQLEGCFLELLRVFEAGKIPEHEAGRFSFAAAMRWYSTGWHHAVFEPTSTTMSASSKSS